MIEYVVPPEAVANSIELEAANSISPLCPHCTAKIEKVLYRELMSVMGKRYLYFCSDCHKVLGISHRKGFWMG